MTKKQLVALCLGFGGCYEDYPFEGGAWAVLRHNANKKGFAFVYEREGRLCVNLKCEPMQGDFWRGVYEGVGPAYHMNKTHWITVWAESDVPAGELEGMIADSYRLTAPKIRRKEIKK